jgi:hypothetical protein
VGARQGTRTHRCQSSPRCRRRPRLRTCLRNECTRKYRPRCYHQRYCQHPDCQRELNRWRSARRQAKRREDLNVKAQHAQAEQARRQRVKSRPQPVEKPELAPPRGHAARTFFFMAIVRSAGLLPTPRQLDPQPSTLLLCPLPAGRAQRPRSGTQVAILRNLGRTEKASHRISDGPAPPRLSTRPRHQPSAVAATARMTVPLPTALVVNYRCSACALVCWSRLLTP